MTRAAFVGIALGITAGIATFIPAIHSLSPTERVWVQTLPRRRQ